MGVLRAYGASGFLFRETREGLEALEFAYNSLYALEATLDTLIELSRYVPPPLRLSLLVGGPFVRAGRSVRGLSSWPPSSEELASAVLPSDRLLFRGAHFESPGFWEVVGALNPFETVRKYLNDRHERRKDADFRNEAERRKFEQEERAREAEIAYMEDSVIIRRIEEARRLGLSEREIAPLLNELLRRPLRKLAHYQDRGLLEHIDIRRLDPGDEK
jgi:hypothetical protein